jgi:hypothetical protein
MLKMQQEKVSLPGLRNNIGIILMLFFMSNSIFCNGQSQIDSMTIIFSKPNIDTWSSICCRGNYDYYYQIENQYAVKNIKDKKLCKEAEIKLVKSNMFFKTDCPNTKLHLILYLKYGKKIYLCMDPRGIFEIGDAVFCNEEIIPWLFKVCDMPLDLY